MMHDELPYHEGGAELDAHMSGWPVGRQADVETWMGMSEACAGCDDRDEREYMHKCEHCDGYTCEGCWQDSRRPTDPHCSHCGNSPIPAERD